MNTCPKCGYVAPVHFNDAEDCLDPIATPDDTARAVGERDISQRATDRIIYDRHKVLERARTKR